MRSRRNTKCVGNDRARKVRRSAFAVATAFSLYVSVAPIALATGEDPNPTQSESDTRAAQASGGVKLHILVIEANRRDGAFDARIRGNVRKHLEEVGYTGARVLDELSTPAVSEGARVQLEILSRGNPNSAQHLGVTALGISTSEVRLRVEIPELRFDTSTRQKPDTTVALAFKTPDGSKLYLAVTPTL
ncbi:MAG: hypothetical protein IPK13_06115 [Deltaproteobacteria bacterium]|nr:hypothetical protein [Deltaproteobacteria bacterium]